MRVVCVFFFWGGVLEKSCLRRNLAKGACCLLVFSLSVRLSLCLVCSASLSNSSIAMGGVLMSVDGVNGEEWFEEKI